MLSGWCPSALQLASSCFSGASCALRDAVSRPLPAYPDLDCATKRISLLALAASIVLVLVSLLSVLRLLLPLPLPLRACAPPVGSPCNITAVSTYHVVIAVVWLCCDKLTLLHHRTPPLPPWLSPFLLTRTTSSLFLSVSSAWPAPSLASLAGRGETGGRGKGGRRDGAARARNRRGRRLIAFQGELSMKVAKRS